MSFATLNSLFRALRWSGQAKLRRARQKVEQRLGGVATCLIPNVLHPTDTAPQFLLKLIFDHPRRVMET